ncbi:MAG: tRNA 2-thiouridine(34) synthase MnmA [Magnetococcales bacterium]|nr:tRNA 2-thiouridine(34) synthase MnmA [Magnetococcales bacterium]
MSGHGQRAAVAMSGGVDSATVAALLVEQGHEVIGLTMRLWDRGDAAGRAPGRACCATEDVHDARRVAQTLGIPFYVVDLTAEFREAVVEDFLAAHAAGRTPNPCARCNEVLKFRHLLDRARQLGASFLATGHYARIEEVEGEPWLMRGLDPGKDQSYFLFATRREDLPAIRFPLGGMRKEETRVRAGAMGLHLARKRESQDLCFLPDGDPHDLFVHSGRTVLAQPGPICDDTGRLLGEHRGLGYYTIGQRHGLGIGGAPHPLHVIAIEPGENRLVVGPASALMRDGLELAALNWLPRHPLTEPVAVLAQIRYASPPQPALLTPLGGDRARIDFRSPQRAIASGQACVLYAQDRVLGGGWIT